MSAMSEMHIEMLDQQEQQEWEDAQAHLWFTTIDALREAHRFLKPEHLDVLMYHAGCTTNDLFPKE